MSASVPVPPSHRCSFNVTHTHTCTKYTPESIAWHPTQNVSAIGCSSLTGDIWDGTLLIQDHTTHHAQAHPSTAGIATVAFTRDGNLITAGDDGHIYVYASPTPCTSSSDTSDMDTSDGKEISKLETKSIQPLQLQHNLYDHADIISSLIILPSHTNHTFISTSYDGTVKLWDLADARYPIRTFTTYDSILYGTYYDQHVVVVTGMDSSLSIIDTRLGEGFSTTATITLEAPSAASQFQSQTHVLAVGCDNGAILLYDIRNLKEPVNVNRSHTSSVRTLAFSPHFSSLLATGGDDSVLELHHLKNGIETIGVSCLWSSYVRSVAWHPSTHSLSPTQQQAHLSVASWDHTIRELNITVDRQSH